MQVFADTNIYLHFQPLDCLDLAEVFGPGDHVVVISRITLHELDEQKTAGRTSKLRDRARTALKNIERWTQQGAHLRNGLTVSYSSDFPQLDYATHGLNPLWGDDVLLATALQYRENNPTLDVAILTEDTGVRLKAKQLGLQVFPPRDEWRLPSEPDPLETENRELLRRIADIEAPLPTLVVSLAGSEGGDAFERFILPIPPTPVDQAVASKMDEVRAKYPPLSPAPPSIPGGVPASVASALKSLSGISPSEYDRYNKGLDPFFAEYERYLRALWDVRELQSRMIVFKVEIANTGSGPAEDVDIHLHFPDGFLLGELDELIDVPVAPSPPARPRSLADSLAAGAFPRVPAHLLSPSIGARMPRAFSIKQTKSYDVRDHFGRIKQGSTVHLPEMAAIFHTREAAESFACDYRLQPVNLPAPVVGKLHFVVTQEEERSQDE